MACYPAEGRSWEFRDRPCSWLCPLLPPLLGDREDGLTVSQGCGAHRETGLGLATSRGLSPPCVPVRKLRQLGESQEPSQAPLGTWSSRPQQYSVVSVHALRSLPTPVYRCGVRPLALAPCSALYRGGQDPGSALPDPCPPAAPGAFCSGASEAGPCPPGDAAGARKIGGPPASRRPQEPLPACQLQERGLGWGCVHPRTTDPRAGPRHPKAPQREWLLGPDGLGSSLGFLLCPPRRLVAG